MVFRLLRPSLAAIRRGSRQDLPVLAHGASTHARGLRLRSVKERLAFSAVLHVAFPLSGQGRHARGLISELDTHPACTPANASAAVLPPPPHSSGPGWFARPFPYDSFIRDSMPVHPGAFPGSVSPDTAMLPESVLPQHSPSDTRAMPKKTPGRGGWPPHQEKTAREASPHYTNFDSQVSQTG